jgi:GGDEF domain-containing protein
VAAPRLGAGTEPTAHDLVHSVAPLGPADTIAAVLQRFAAMPSITAIPVVEGETIRGVVSRTQLELIAASPGGERLTGRPCLEVADETPIRVEARMELGDLTALLVESDARRLADGFVIVSGGRYLGMGTSADVMRALQTSRVLAARYTNPLTLLPGQVPINEHLERLLAGRRAFTAWFAELDQMRGLNDALGFERGDALIHDLAGMLEGICQPGVDFVGHVAGARFAVLMQSDDWLSRARGALEHWPGVRDAHVPPDVAARGYFTAKTRDGVEKVRPLPRLAIGILPVLPGVFESRHEVVETLRQAVRRAMEEPGSSFFVDEQHGNAYPQSLLMGSDPD